MRKDTCGIYMYSDIYVRITHKDGECKMTLVWHIHVHVIVMKTVWR